MKILSKSLKETDVLAKVFLEKLLSQKNSATIVVLSGDLGSGKTTFVQSIARLLGIKDHITSPTFVIMKKFTIYDSPNESKLRTGQARFAILTHIDAYRLKNGEELKKLGWTEIIADPQNLIFIEWPENVADAVPKNVIKISFEFIDENTRKIII